MPFEGSRAHYDPGVEFRIGRMELVGNTGTYLDAPGHRIREGADIGGLELSRVADLPGVVIRVPVDQGRGVDRERIEDALEAMANQGEPGTAGPFKGMAVLFQTGWDSRWGTPDYFEGHPFLTRDAAETLRDGGAVLVGMDTLNVDDTTDGARPAHTLLLGAGIPIVENLTGLEQLPDRGFFFSAVPAKVAGMTSFPVRAWGRVG
jgi:kynurenine formamidase